MKRREFLRLIGGQVSAIGVGVGISAHLADLPVREAVRKVTHIDYENRVVTIE